MTKTKDILDSLEKKEALIDYFKQVKLAAFYDLVVTKEVDKQLKKLANKDNISIYYKDNMYLPYLDEETKDFVFAYRKTTYDENGGEVEIEKQLVSLLPVDDFHEHYNELKEQDYKYHQKLSSIHHHAKDNTTRKYILIVAYTATIIGGFFALDAFTYDPLQGFLFLLGTLLTTASLFGLAEIIKLLSKS